MRSIRLFLAASAIFCLTVNTLSAAGRTALPWVLEKDDEGGKNSPVSRYLQRLGREDRKDVIELDKQLRARIAEDRKIVAANAAGKEGAQKEIERYEKFLFALGDPIRFCFNGKIDTAKKSMTFESFQVSIHRRTTKVMRNPKDKKYYFYGDNGEPEYIRGKDLELAKEEIQRMGYISLFCANQKPDTPSQEFTQISSKAAVCCIAGRAALKNNSLSVVIFHPMPAKGALHDALAKQALACALRPCPNAVAVVIGDSEWSIQRNRIGVILRRVCNGWIIVKDDIGRRAIPAKWAQPNQGGSSYGNLHLFIYGGNKRFYVK